MEILLLIAFTISFAGFITAGVYMYRYVTAKKSESN